MVKRIQFGLTEKSSPKEIKYDPSLFDSNSRYGEALCLLDRFLNCDKRYDDRQRGFLKLQLIHECEEARRWRQLPTDFPTERTNYFDNLSKEFSRVQKAIEQIQKVDEKYAYHLRYVFHRSLERFAENSKNLDITIPDPNHPDGGEQYFASSKIRAHIEHTLIWRVSLFEFAELLQNFKSTLNEYPHLANPHRQLGCLQFDPPLSRKTASKLKVDVAGLSARLSYHLREWTAGRGAHAYWAGIVMPEDGRPCWGIVAPFVNGALELNVPETEETLRQRWYALNRRNRVRLDPWPREALREAQVVE